ncbi:inorganic phosphate transporter [Sphingomonas bacterium]|uniref:inorganic phosphate transporter n=1 Tax=Sphingomonas bacterium TaxID=1895847 RepID=UPI001C2D121A|nr:inorganic phosphate transporter [Sphingomonas bacterium]
MASVASQSAPPLGRLAEHRVHPAAATGFLLVLLAGLGFAAVNIVFDTRDAGEPLATGAFLFLGLALVVALAFEFVNGFHDTANAVATVIYTHSLRPVPAVLWSGGWNFVGVVASSGAVAYSIITLLPADLVMGVGSAAGYAMIFALLIAALIWNLGTWWLGLPNSSSHALIGSVLGVGLANQLLAKGVGGAAGVDWGQAKDVLLALLVSPAIGFLGAGGLLFAMKRLVRDRTLYEQPKGDAPPPRGIRALLILTCTAVSFAHGGNDGQKGMGLIMLILIGVAPTAYALNRTMPDSSTSAFVATAARAKATFLARAGDVRVAPVAAATILRQAIRSRDADHPRVHAALAAEAEVISADLKEYGSIRRVPAAATPNLRNEMYLTLDASRLLTKDTARADGLFPNGGARAVVAYQDLLERGTRYIPTWVKVTVALALGLGTMIGWRRIVVTVGEKIGKQHLTYGMGASAELVAAATILLAQVKGMPVSTTHILSSGVAGTMTADGAGLQGATVRNIALAWVMTLPAAMVLAGLLYALLLAGVHVAGLG